MDKTFKDFSESVQDELYAQHQELRKKSGLPHPDYYKELGKSYDIEDDAERAEKQKEIRKKYGQQRTDEETQMDESRFDPPRDYKVQVDHEGEDGKTDSKIHVIKNSRHRYGAMSIASDRHQKDLEKQGIKIGKISARIVEEVVSLNEWDATGHNSTDAHRWLKANGFHVVGRGKHPKLKHETTNEPIVGFNDHGKEASPQDLRNTRALIIAHHEKHNIPYRELNKGKFKMHNEELEQKKRDVVRKTIDSIRNKNKVKGNDKFNPDPELSEKDTIVKT